MPGIGRASPSISVSHSRSARGTDYLSRSSEQHSRPSPSEYQRDAPRSSSTFGGGAHPWESSRPQTFSAVNAAGPGPPPPVPAMSPSYGPTSLAPVASTQQRAATLSPRGARKFEPTYGATPAPPQVQAQTQNRQFQVITKQTKKKRRVFRINFLTPIIMLSLLMEIRPHLRRRAALAAAAATMHFPSQAFQTTTAQTRWR